MIPRLNSNMPHGPEGNREIQARQWGQRCPSPQPQPPPFARQRAGTAASPGLCPQHRALPLPQAGLGTRGGRRGLGEAPASPQSPAELGPGVPAHSRGGSAIWCRLRGAPPSRCRGADPTRYPCVPTAQPRVPITPLWGTPKAEGLQKEPPQYPIIFPPGQDGGEGGRGEGICLANYCSHQMSLLIKTGRVFNFLFKRLPSEMVIEFQI